MLGLSPRLVVGAAFLAPCVILGNAECHYVRISIAWAEQPFVNRALQGKLRV
jgi:hypothetical protein